MFSFFTDGKLHSSLLRSVFKGYFCLDAWTWQRSRELSDGAGFTQSSGPGLALSWCCSTFSSSSTSPLSTSRSLLLLPLKLPSPDSEAAPQMRADELVVERLQAGFRSEGRRDGFPDAGAFSLQEAGQLKYVWPFSPRVQHMLFFVQSFALCPRLPHSMSCLGFSKV